VVQKRAHVFIPELLLAEIDELVGKGKRSSLITEILEHEVRRRRLLQILDGDQPARSKPQDMANHTDPRTTKLYDGARTWRRSARSSGALRSSEVLRQLPDCIRVSFSFCRLFATRR
jgi:hypothetical protein